MKKSKKIPNQFDMEVKKISKHKENPNSFLSKNPVWRFSKRDKEHPKWKINSEDIDEFILEKLCSYETMTWDEILKANGGRNQGNNNHYIEINLFINEAKKRIEELNIFEDSLFSLRLSGKVRLLGILRDGIFTIIWLDNEHEIYKIKK